MSPIRVYISKVQDGVKPFINLKSGLIFITIILSFTILKCPQDFADFGMIFVEFAFRLIYSPVALVILCVILLLFCIVSRDIKIIIERMEVRVLVNVNISEQNLQPGAPGVGDQFVSVLSQEREFI